MGEKHALTTEEKNDLLIRTQIIHLKNVELNDLMRTYNAILNEFAVKKGIKGPFKLSNDFKEFEEVEVKPPEQPKEEQK